MTSPGATNSSANFKTLGPITQSTYRNEIEKFCAKHGDKPVARLDRRGVKALINAKADRPGAVKQALPNPQDADAVRD
jgi:hypothetical protein